MATLSEQEQEALADYVADLHAGPWPGDTARLTDMVEAILSARLAKVEALAGGAEKDVAEDWGVRSQDGTRWFPTEAKAEAHLLSREWSTPNWLVHRRIVETRVTSPTVDQDGGRG